MNIDTVQSLIVTSVQTALVLALPFLGISLITGVLVSLLQAVTQVNEQTLTFVPKLLVIMVVFVLLFPWALNTMSVYMHDLYSLIPEIRP